MQPNDGTILARVYKLTQNKQDAEDALQSAYLYQLTRRLKRKHFIWKALNVAKNNYRDKAKEVFLSSPDQGEGFELFCDQSFTENRLAAKQEYDIIFNRLSKHNQKLLTILLEHDGKMNEAAESSGIKYEVFKSLFYRLRTGQI